MAKRIVIDPGVGFGKSLQHNLTLLAHIDRLVNTGYPVLVGVSRKSTIGTLLDRPVGERLPGSLGLAVQAALNGVAILRVHDVAATADAIAVVDAVQAAAGEASIA